MDESSASSEIGGAGERSKIKTDKIGDIDLGRCQLRVSGYEAEGKNIWILLIFISAKETPMILTCKRPSPFIDLGAD